MSVMRKERGFTLVELSIVVIIMGIMATIGVWSKMQELRDELAKSQGQQLVRLNDAIGTYMVNNYAALVNGSPIGGVANTMSPTVAELRTLGILDAGFSANNLYGGGYTTALTLVPAACAPPNCNISSLVYLTTQIIDPNTGRVDGPRLGVAQGVAGGDAAYSLPATPAVFTGSGGGWTAANPLNMAGILAMRNGTGSSAWAQFLRRDGSLPMTGNLDMGGQAINNAATIALNTVVANGAACATNGVVARDANGAVMSCQSGAWRSQGSAFWQDPVVNAASLPACNASSIWQTRVVENPTVGSGPRAYTCNGASWQALAVNDAGNITIPGLMTAANATITGATTTNQLAGNLEVTVTATVNTACSPNGRIARDANGLLLSCQSGVWKKASGDSGKIISSAIPTTFFPAWTACASGTASTRRFYITAAGQLYATSGCNYSLLFNICNLASGSCAGPDPLSTCYTWGMTAKYSLTPAGLLIINSNSYVDGWGSDVSCGTVFPPWES